jgi:hypothetical protein
MKRGNRKEFGIIVSLSFAIVFGVLCGMGTINCGYHLVDDHEFLEYTYMFKFHNASPWGLIRDWVGFDIGRGRFRPLYYTIRIMLTYLLGTDLLRWSILRGIVVATSIILLYYCGKMICGSCISSFSFALVSLMGFQSAVWWKLGPQEDFATLLFALGFLLQLLWLKSMKTGYAVSSVIVYSAMACYKESYILLLPFAAAYVIYDVYKDCSSIYDMRIQKQMMKGYRLYTWSIIGVFCVLIALLLHYTGWTSVTHPDIGIADKFKLYRDVFVKEFTTDLRWYRWTGLLLIAVLLTYWNQVRKLWKEIILIVIFILPQFMVYADAGLIERYILPASIGFGMFFLVFIPNSKILGGKRRIFYVAVIISLLLLNGRSMLVEADYFRYRGNSVETLLNEADRLMTSDDIKLVSCFSPNEESNMTIKAWLLLHGKDQVYYYHEETGKIDKEFQYDTYPEYTGANSDEVSIDDMDLIVMYNTDDRHYNHEPTINRNGFNGIKCGTLTMYVRDGAGIPMPDINVKSSRYY